MVVACGQRNYKDNEKLAFNCVKLYKSVELGKVDQAALEFVKNFGKVSGDLNTAEGRQNFIKTIADGIGSKFGTKLIDECW